jgi:hypothetical protein
MVAWLCLRELRNHGFGICLATASGIAPPLHGEICGARHYLSSILIASAKPAAPRHPGPAFPPLASISVPPWLD